MVKPIGILISLLLVTAIHAAEIVAWKIPLSSFTWQSPKDGAIARCEKPPELSPFFNNGDELWDLSTVEHAKAPKIGFEWLVWNATSGRLVAKGDWAQLSAMHALLRPGQLPKLCRLTLRAYPVTDAARPVDLDSEPLAEHTLLARSGRKSEVNWKDGDHAVTLIAEPFIGEYEAIIDLKLEATIRTPGQHPLAINTALTLRTGGTEWIARDFDGQAGIDLTVTAVVESLDGSPIHERVMIQSGNTTTLLKPRSMGTFEEPVKIGDSGWFVQTHMTPFNMTQFVEQSEADPDADPFAEPSPDELKRLPEAAAANPPAILKPWLGHEILDAGPWLRDLGLWKDGDFSGYDPISERLCFFSKNRQSIDNFVDLFEYLDGGLPPLVFITLEGSSQSKIIARNGQIARVSRLDGEKKSTRLFEIEPTIGENEEMVDLRFVFEELSDPARSIKINSQATLLTNEWSELSSSRVPGAGASKLRIKAEVIRRP